MGNSISMEECARMQRTMDQRLVDAITKLAELNIQLRQKKEREATYIQNLKDEIASLESETKTLKEHSDKIWDSYTEEERVAITKIKEEEEKKEAGAEKESPESIREESRKLWSSFTSEEKIAYCRSEEGAKYPCDDLE